MTWPEYSLVNRFHCSDLAIIFARNATHSVRIILNTLYASVCVCVCCVCAPLLKRQEKQNDLLMVKRDETRKEEQMEQIDGRAR